MIFFFLLTKKSAWEAETGKKRKKEIISIFALEENENQSKYSHLSISWVMHAHTQKGNFAIKCF